MLRELTIPYGERTLTFRVPERNLMAYATPRATPPAPDPVAEIRRALENPIGAPRLDVLARGARNVVIIADDLTRQTPSHLIIPLLLDELNRAGVRDDQVQVLIALGTHRPMTDAEIEKHFTRAVTSRVRVINSPWHDPAQLADLGTTPNGTPIHVARLAVEADLLIGLGSIVPHHIPGYSAGAKIVQPGVSGAATTGATHLLSTRTRRSYLGLVESPVRDEMETIAERVGMRVILNCVLNAEGKLVRAFYGDMRAAFRAGVATSRAVYGVPIPAQAEIVIAGSHPCDIEFWQAHKSLYPADIAVKDGGTVIVVTPSPEGVSVTHHEMLNFTALDAATILARIEDGTIRDVVSGALALAWAKMRERAHISLVSDGISAEDAHALAFTPFASVDDALAAAFARHGNDARVTILTHAPDMLPLVESE